MSAITNSNCREQMLKTVHGRRRKKKLETKGEKIIYDPILIEHAVAAMKSGTSLKDAAAEFKITEFILFKIFRNRVSKNCKNIKSKIKYNPNFKWDPKKSVNAGPSNQEVEEFKTQNDPINTYCGENKKGLQTQYTSQKNLNKKQKMKKKKKKFAKIIHNPDNIEVALEAMESGLSVIDASIKFEVNKTVLYKMFKNRINQNNPNEKINLTESEENSILEWILHQMRKGVPVRKKDFYNYAKKILAGTRRTNLFQCNKRLRLIWFSKFNVKHKDVCQYVGKRLSEIESVREEIEKTLSERSKSKSQREYTREDLKSWFAQVKQQLESKNLCNISSDRIFNIGETAWVHINSEKEVMKAEDLPGTNEKNHWNVLWAASASGKIIPPMVSFDTKITSNSQIYPVIWENIPKDWTAGHSRRGCISADSFAKYITDVFFKYLKENNHTFPVVLYVNDNSSQITQSLIEFCKQNEIELVKLYQNSVHLAQPLKIFLFNEVLDKYAEVKSEWRIQNEENLPKQKFAPLLKFVLENTNFSQAIISGFQKCGLSPFNPEILDCNSSQETMETS